MKTMKHLAVAGLLGGSVLVSTPAMAELTGNAGVMSQYLFRGLEQGPSAAGYGGIDYAHESGFYVGTWAATIGFASGSGSSSEVDFYTGYAGEAGSVAYDVGVIYYWYSEEDEVGNADPTNNTIELYGSLGFGPVTLSAYYAPDSYFAANDPDEPAATQAGTEADGAYGAYLSFSHPLTDVLSFDAAVGYNAGEGNEFYGADSSGAGQRLRHELRPGRHRYRVRCLRGRSQARGRRQLQLRPAVNRRSGDDLRGRVRAAPFLCPQGQEPAGRSRSRSPTASATCGAPTRGDPARSAIVRASLRRR